MHILRQKPMELKGYWDQRDYERFNDRPKGATAFRGQRRGWKTPRGSLLAVDAEVVHPKRFPWCTQVRGT